MIRLRAILAGAFAVIFMGLLVELALIFVRTGYYELKKIYPWTETAGLIVGYPVGLAVFTAIMVGGGYLAARLSRSDHRLNAGIAGFLATATSMIPMIVTHGETNLNGVLFVVFGTAFAVGGGVLRLRRMENAAGG